MAKHLNSIEIRHLRLFLAAAEHGSFRRAGNALRIQQSSISRRVRDLEDHLGASLFQRQKCGVSLTLAGERFLRRTRAVLLELETGTREVASIGRCEAGRVRLGISSSLASGFLADLLREYERAHPAVDLVVVEGDPRDHISEVRKLRFDIAFVTGSRNWPGCETDFLWSERVFVALPVGHDLAEREFLDWSDLEKENFIVGNTAIGRDIHDLLVHNLSRPGHHPHIQAQYVARENIFSLVAIGLGLTLASEAATANGVPGILFLPIAQERIPFSAVWSIQNDNPASRRFLSLARSMSNLSGASRTIAGPN